MKVEQFVDGEPPRLGYTQRMHRKISASDTPRPAQRSRASVSSTMAFGGGLITAGLPDCTESPPIRPFHRERVIARPIALGYRHGKIESRVRGVIGNGAPSGTSA